MWMAVPTQVPFQPLVALDELVDHGKIVGVGLVWHHPATRDHLQLPVLNQPAGKSSQARSQRQVKGTVQNGDWGQLYIVKRQYTALTAWQYLLMASYDHYY